MLYRLWWIVELWWIERKLRSTWPEQAAASWPRYRRLVLRYLHLHTWLEYGIPRPCLCWVATLIMVDIARQMPLLPDCQADVIVALRREWPDGWYDFFYREGIGFGPEAFADLEAPDPEH